jgi:ribosome-associated protein
MAEDPGDQPSAAAAAALDGADAAPQGRLRVSRSLSIPLRELEWRATTPGGPGGQHANRTSSRVEVRFDVERSPTLGPRQRAVLLERLGSVVRSTAGESRSQARNREVAQERLAQRLAAALRPVRPRRPTRPTAGARERRLEEKHLRGDLKRQRRAGDDDS